MSNQQNAINILDTKKDQFSDAEYKLIAEALGRNHNKRDKQWCKLTYLVVSVSSVLRVDTSTILYKLETKRIAEIKAGIAKDGMHPVIIPEQTLVASHSHFSDADIGYDDDADRVTINQIYSHRLDVVKITEYNE